MQCHKKCLLSGLLACQMAAFKLEVLSIVLTFVFVDFDNQKKTELSQLLFEKTSCPFYSGVSSVHC